MNHLRQNIKEVECDKWIVDNNHICVSITIYWMVTGKGSFCIWIGMC